MRVPSFRPISLPGGEQVYLPSTVCVTVPETAEVEADRQHLLAHIPWNNYYLTRVPERYRDFFKFVLPHLSVRTTNVHTALSLKFVPELHAGIDPQADIDIVSLAVIVHDCGWSQVSAPQIADSLDYSGIMFTAKAAEAKQLHTVHGGRLARELLIRYDFNIALAQAEIDYISDIVLYHERPREYRQNGAMPSELIIACEADRLWPFTHENFWLDIIRKGVEPAAYIQNVATSVEGLFLTDTGRSIAWRFINDRLGEVAEYERHVAALPQAAHGARGLPA